MSDADTLCQSMGAQDGWDDVDVDGAPAPAPAPALAPAEDNKSEFRYVEIAEQSAIAACGVCFDSNSTGTEGPTDFLCIHASNQGTGFACAHNAKYISGMRSCGEAHA